MENSAVPLPVTDKLVISSFLPDILRHCPLTSSDRTIAFVEFVYLSISVSDPYSFYADPLPAFLFTLPERKQE